MKKSVLFGALLVSAALSARAQESRQDASISAFEVIAPQVAGQSVTSLQTTLVTGVLGSYRYLLTPRVGLELNYGWSQNSLVYSAYSAGVQFGRVHTREQEISAAILYSRNYRNFNPFIEVGPGAMIYTPILDAGSQQRDLRQSTGIGGLFGAGLAYEISPSFDIRAEYRGFVTKVPSFGYTPFVTNRYYVVSTPSIGIAYHF